MISIQLWAARPPGFEEAGDAMTASMQHHCCRAEHGLPTAAVVRRKRRPLPWTSLRRREVNPHRLRRRVAHPGDARRHGQRSTLHRERGRLRYDETLHSRASVIVQDHLEAPFATTLNQRPQCCAPGCLDPSNQFLKLFAALEIGFSCPRLIPGGTDLRCDHFQRLYSTPHHDDARTLGGEHGGRGAADAGTTAGDQSHLALRVSTFSMYVQAPPLRLRLDASTRPPDHACRISCELNTRFFLTRNPHRSAVDARSG